MLIEAFKIIFKLNHCILESIFIWFLSEQAKAEENRQGGANTNVEDMEEGSSSEDEEEEEGEDGAVPQPIGKSNFNY